MFPPTQAQIDTIHRSKKGEAELKKAQGKNHTKSDRLWVMDMTELVQIRCSILYKPEPTIGISVALSWGGIRKPSDDEVYQITFALNIVAGEEVFNDKLKKVRAFKLDPKETRH